jgi:hypothetical protein
VVGCSSFTELSRAADCVRPPSYWPRCDVEHDDKCASGWGLLPGGRGRATLFFPLSNQRSARTYGAVLAPPPPSNVTAARKAYSSAARQFVAAQLNFLSGARLPGEELQAAYDGVSGYLASSAEGAVVPKERAAVLTTHTTVLARYNNGTLPASMGAPRRC